MIGIDIGGANLKIATDDYTRIEYCPLWEGADLFSRLVDYRDERAAVVITGELADCFGSKMEGIKSIVSTVKKAIPDAIFFGTDGNFYNKAVPQLAAANWLASAFHLMERYHGRILVDMGSTTTDIIPLVDIDSLLGLTDLQRLQRGYLVYTGLLRTPVAAMIDAVEIQSIRTPVSSEVFAIAADVHLLLGHIDEMGYTCPPPDGKEIAWEASIRRLARMVCADPDEIGEDGILEMASQIWRVQKTTIMNAIERTKISTGADGVITAGIGSGLLAREFAGRDLSDEIGSFAEVLPAHAVKEVALRGAGRSR